MVTKCSEDVRIVSESQSKEDLKVEKILARRQNMEQLIKILLSASVRGAREYFDSLAIHYI